jgi:hypothetical protein
MTAKEIQHQIKLEELKLKKIQNDILTGKYIPVEFAEIIYLIGFKIGSNFNEKE